MKNLPIYLLMSFLFFTSCEPTDNETNETITEPEAEVKFISKISGYEQAEFMYENGLLIKGLGNSTSLHFNAAFEVIYDSNQRVKQVLTNNSKSYDKPANFNFNLSEEPFVEVLNYNYENNKLTSITTSEGPEHEFFYDNKGNVIKHLAYNSYTGTYLEFKYTYDSNNKITNHYFYSSRNGATSNGPMIGDDKINPFYNFWKNNSLYMPWDVSVISSYNLSFYPHNILKGDSGVEEFEVEMQYENGYPVFYHKKDINPIIIEYLD